MVKSSYQTNYRPSAEQRFKDACLKNNLAGVKSYLGFIGADLRVVCQGMLFCTNEKYLPVLQALLGYKTKIEADPLFDTHQTSLLWREVFIALSKKTKGTQDSDKICVPVIESLTKNQVKLLLETPFAQHMSPATLRIAVLKGDCCDQHGQIENMFATDAALTAYRENNPELFKYCFQFANQDYIVERLNSRKQARQNGDFFMGFITTENTELDEFIDTFMQKKRLKQAVEEVVAETDVGQTRKRKM